MGDVTPTTRMASASVCGVYINLVVPSPLKINKMILTLGTNRLLSIWPRAYHNWTLISPKLKYFPQTAPIVRTQFGS